MEPIKIRGKLTDDDYLKSILLNFGQYRVLFSLFGLMYILGFLYVLFSNWSLGILLIPYSLPALILPALFLLWRYILLPRNITHIFNQQKDLGSPFTIEITDEEFKYENEYGQSQRPWSDFVKWKENDQVFSIFQSDVAINIIPKRCFNNQEEITRLRNYLSSNIVPVERKALKKFRRILVIAVIIIAILISVSSYLNQASQFR